MGTPSRTTNPGRLRRLLGGTFPCRAVALLAGAGFSFEALALLVRPDSIYRNEAVSVGTVLLGLAWFWYTAGWLVWAGGVGLEVVTRRGPRWLAAAAWGAAALLAAGGVVAYASSWGLYCQAGRFATWEVIQFFVNNARETWLFLVLAQRRELILVGLLGLAVLATAPFYLRALVRARRTRSATPNQARRGRLAWGVVATLAVGLFGAERADNSLIRRGMAVDALCNRLNPVVTLASSVAEAFLETPIAPCLDPADLRPLDTPWQPPPATAGNRPSVVFVAVESLRWDVVHLVHQGREVTPHLNALARGGLYLPRCYAMSTHSDYADPSIYSSLYPLRSRRHHYYQASDPWPKALVYDVVKTAGYATAHISSQSERWGCMDQFFASPNLDYFLDAETGDGPKFTPKKDPGVYQEVQAGMLGAGYLQDGYTVGVAVDWIKKQARGQPFYLNVTLENSHFPYDLAADTPRPFQPCALPADIHFLNYPVEAVPVVRNAYYNAIHECDRQLGRLVQALRETGRLDNTILVVTGDNGEAFHENGSVGHAMEPTEPEVRVACVIHAPGRLKPGTDDYPTQHIDLVPTALGLMGWPAHPNLQGIDLLARDRKPLAERLIFLHTENPVVRTDAVILAGRWKFHHKRSTGEEMLYDLQADPSESKNLLADDPARANQLRAVLASWRDRQLAYYHYPNYYRSFYPPQPPAVLPQPE
jgi:arylsulfatase A-like enzyme